MRLPLGACAMDCTLDRRSRKLASSLSSRHISRTQSFQEKRTIKIKDLATLKRFVAVIGRPVPCTARLASRRTDRQTKYRNPRCACAPRVNNYCIRQSKRHNIYCLHEICMLWFWKKQKCRDGVMSGLVSWCRFLSFS